MMVFYTLVLQFYLKKGKNKKRRWYFLRKKTEEEKQCYHDMISVDRKARVFPVKLKLQGTLFYLNKYIKKEIFKKELMDLI